MKPVSDFTTPRRLIAPISRHFLPVEQPEPFCCTTGLKNGSRLPVIAHFFSSGLGCLVPASLLAVAGAGALMAGDALIVEPLAVDAAIVVEPVLVAGGVIAALLA